MHGNKDWYGSTHLRNTETLTESTVRQRISSGICSQDSIRCSSMTKSKCLLLRLGEAPENFTGRLIFMTTFNGISCGARDNEKGCLSNANLVSLSAKRFGKGQWTFIGPGSEKKWYSISEDSPQGEWDNMSERMLLELAESGCPLFRATSPLYTIVPIWIRKTVFRVNQFSLHDAVAEMCEEYETLRDRSGQPVVRRESSSTLVLSVIQTEIPLDFDDPANQGLPLQQYGERIDKLSQHVEDGAVDMTVLNETARRMHDTRRERRKEATTRSGATAPTERHCADKARHTKREQDKISILRGSQKHTT